MPSKEPQFIATIEVEKYLSRLRTQGELAEEMGVSRDYILAMKRHGFRTPGGKASLRMARAFIETCEEFQVVQPSASPK